MSISETDYVLLRIISFRMLVLINKINNDDLEVAHLQSGSSSTSFLVELGIGIWKCWFLRRGENRSTRRKTSRSKGENQQQSQPTYGVNAGIWARVTLVGVERSHHCAIPCLAHVRYRLSITVLDSGFHHVDSGLLVSGTWIPDSLSWIPDSKVQESKFQKQKLPGFQNLDYLTCQLFNTSLLCW